MSKKGAKLGHLQLTVTNDYLEQEPSLQTSVALAPDRGVLFTWNTDTRDPIWLKNTTFSLDIALIDTSGRITEIKSVDLPSEEQFRPRYPYRQAIVANRGFFEQNNIRTGNDAILAVYP